MNPNSEDDSSFVKVNHESLLEAEVPVLLYIALEIGELPKTPIGSMARQALTVLICSDSLRMCSKQESVVRELLIEATIKERKIGDEHRNYPVSKYRAYSRGGTVSKLWELLLFYLLQEGSMRQWGLARRVAGIGLMALGQSMCYTLKSELEDVDPRSGVGKKCPEYSRMSWQFELTRSVTPREGAYKAKRSLSLGATGSLSDWYGLIAERVGDDHLSEIARVLAHGFPLAGHFDVELARTLAKLCHRLQNLVTSEG